MKNRKGFKDIMVDNKKYKFSFSFIENRKLIIFYDENDNRYEVDFTNTKFPNNEKFFKTWYGKNKNRFFGKREANFLISFFKKNLTA